MIQRLLIPGKLPGLNDLLRVRNNGYAYNALKKRWETEIGWCIKRANLKPMPGPVKLHFWWIEATRRRDKDNIAAGGRKLILDALVANGILAGDGWTHIDEWTDMFRVSRVNPGVFVTMEEYEDG